MALSSLVPQTVSSISLLAKSMITGLQIWSLYGLLLTIEASGFSYVTHVLGYLNLYTLYTVKRVGYLYPSVYSLPKITFHWLCYILPSHVILLPCSLFLKQWSIWVAETRTDAWESAPFFLYLWWFNNFDLMKEG